MAVLLVDDGHSAEFHEARRSLAAQTRLQTVADLPQAQQALAAQQHAPHLMVIAQARPGEATAREVDVLRRDAPLSAIVALLGSWCEGEMRSGQPWPANERVFWYAWTSWWPRQRARLASGGAATWNVPLTSSREERLLLESELELAPRGSGRVAIGGSTAVCSAAVAEAVRAAGYEPLPLKAGEHVAADEVASGVWDAAQLDQEQCEQLTRFRRAIGHRPVVLLLDLPTLDQWQAAQRLGVTHVLGKPFAVTDLLQALAEVPSG